MERRYGAEAAGGPLPVVRHDLLGHPGAPGRGARALRGAARRDGRRGRVQLQQHLPPGGAGAIQGRPHLPHRGCRGRGPGRRRRSGTSRSAPGTRSTAGDWLGRSRVIGITAGASTPNNKVGETIARICALAGVSGELRATDRVSSAPHDPRRSQPYHRPRHDDLPRPAGARSSATSSAARRRARTTRRASSSISARSRWWPTPAPTSTRRSTATPTARTCRSSRWSRWPTSTPSSIRRRAGGPGNRPATRSPGASSAGKAVLVQHRLGRALGPDRAYFEGHPFLTADAAEYLREPGRRAGRASTRSTSTTPRDLARPVHSTLLRRRDPDRRTPVQSGRAARARASASSPCRSRSRASGPSRCGRSRSGRRESSAPLRHCPSGGRASPAVFRSRCVSSQDTGSSIGSRWVNTVLLGTAARTSSSTSSSRSWPRCTDQLPGTST